MKTGVCLLFLLWRSGGEGGLDVLISEGKQISVVVEPPEFLV